MKPLVFLLLICQCLLIAQSDQRGQLLQSLAARPFDMGLIAQAIESSADTFEYMAGFAKEAVNSAAPEVFLYDSDGRQIPGKVNPAFENWCARNGLDLKAEGSRQIHTYAQDVLLLAKTKDRRAIEILQKGLESESNMVAASSALGLLVFLDKNSIPKLAAAAVRVRPIASVFMECLAEFGDSEQRVILDLLPGATLREQYSKALAEKKKRDAKLPSR